MASDGRANGRPSDEEIATKAHELWLHEGQPEGRAMDHWMAAEQMLIAERQQQQGQGRSEPEGRQGQGQQPQRGGQPQQQRRRQAQPGA